MPFNFSLFHFLLPLQRKNLRSPNKDLKLFNTVFLSFSRAFSYSVFLTLYLTRVWLGSSQPSFHSNLKYSMVLALTKAPISVESRSFSSLPSLTRANQPHIVGRDSWEGVQPKEPEIFTPTMVITDGSFLLQLTLLYQSLEVLTTS